MILPVNSPGSGVQRENVSAVVAGNSRRGVDGTTVHQYITIRAVEGEDETRLVLRASGFRQSSQADGSLQRPAATRRFGGRIVGDRIFLTTVDEGRQIRQSWPSIENRESSFGKRMSTRVPAHHPQKEHSRHVHGRVGRGTAVHCIGKRSM
jgi:hypothetical protein